VYHKAMSELGEILTFDNVPVNPGGYLAKAKEWW
jgi:hypothetical protein